MKNHKASVLAVSLIIMGVMIIIALGISSSSIQSRKSSIGSSKSTVAFQNADSGVEIVMQKIRDNAGGSVGDIYPDGGGLLCTVSTNGIFAKPGVYRVELINATETPVGCGDDLATITRVKAIGFHGQDARAIEAAVGGGACNWETFGSEGSSTNQFAVPRDVDLDLTNNKLYVIDMWNYRVARMDSGGGGTTFGANWQTFGSGPASGVGRFAYSEDIAVDSIHNKVYVADVGGQHITRFDSGSGGTTFGANWETFGSMGSGSGQFTDPRNMDVDAANNKVYVIDDLVRLSRFDSGSGGTTFGANWETFGSFGNGVGQFWVVSGIFVDSANNKVYVSDDYNYRIERFDSGSGGTTLGANWQTFGTGGTGTNQFGHTEDIYVDSTGNKVYLDDRSNNRIVRFDSGSGGTTFGANWQEYGSLGSGVGQFDYPDGIRFDPISQKVFVSEGGNHRVDRFSLDCFSAAVTPPSTPSCIPSGFANASLCTGDDPVAPLTPAALVASCSAPVGSLPKCEYTCDATYTFSGGVCVPDCTGGGIVNDLIGYWNMDENSGSNANDTNSNIPANDAAITNGSWTSGKFGSTVNFNGSSAYAETPEIADPGPYGGLQAGSISAWVNVDQIDNTCDWWGWKNVISSYSSTQGALSWMQWYLGNDFQEFGGNCTNDAHNMHIVQEWKTKCAGGPHAILKTVNPIDITSVTGWHLVTFTTNGTDTAKIYWDGVEQPSEFLPGDCSGSPIGNAVDFLNDINNMGDPFYGHFFDIGALHTMSGVSDYYNGAIDDVRIYDRALDSCDVSDLYDYVPPSYSCTGSVPANASLCSGDDTEISPDTPRTLVASCGAPKCEYTCSSGYTKSGNTCVPVVTDCTGNGMTAGSGLAGHWKLDDASGTNANDSSSSNNDGTLSGSPAWYTGGLNFDGVNDYIETPANNMYDGFNTGTLLVWGNFGDSTAQSAIASYSTTDTISSIMTWERFNGSPGNFQLAQGWKTAADPGYWNWIITGNIPVDDECHLAAYVADGVGRTKIYFDGVEQSTGYYPDNPAVPGQSQADFIRDVNEMSAHPHFLTIGAWHRAIDPVWEPTSPSNFFQGQIGEVQLYNRALSSAEINNVKNGGAAVPNITVRAQGTVGDERMELRLNGSLLDTWTLSTGWQNYTAAATVTASDTLSVSFINDAGSRDVEVDYIIVDGTTYQAENQAINTGVWNSGSGACGGASGDMMHCNGTIEFPMGASAPVSDDFNRSTGLGTNWTQQPGDTGTVVINSNIQLAAQTTSDAYAYWRANSFNDDQYSEATLANVNGSDDSGVTVRASSSQLTDYRFTWYPGPSTWYLAKHINGTYTELGSFNGFAAWPGAKIKITAVGNVITGYIDGWAAVQAVDSSITSGYPGVFLGDTNTYLDDWVGGDLGGSLPAKDYFNRADGSLGSTWTETDPDAFTIVGNEVQPSAVGEQAARWNARSFSDDQYAQARVTQVDLDGVQVGIAVRIQKDNTRNYYNLYFDSGQLYLARTDNGAWVDLGQFGVPAVGDILRLEASGNQISAYRNGALLSTVTDSTYSSGSPGLSVYDSSVQLSIDDWEGGDLPAVSDNFDRSNGALGSNWTTITAESAPSISSNQVTGTGATRNSAFWNASSLNSDQWSQVIIRAFDGANLRVGPAVRMQSGSESYYAVQVGTARWRYSWLNSGVFQELMGYDRAMAVGDVIRLQVIGNVLTTYINGVAQTPYTHATPLSGGRPGVNLYGTIPKLDDWRGGNM